jgi:aminopeptidase YwaD
MYHDILTGFDRELSGERAHRLAARISQWHRIQASPMYREAASWVHETLRGWGLAAELETFPVREGLSAWGEPLFQEWSCDEGWLELPLAGGGALRLADYSAVPLSLLPRSASAEGEFELAVVEGGDRLEDYAGRDVRGKLVLTRRLPMSVHRVAIEQLGAAGVIFDGMRAIPELCPPGDLPDAIQYASWWWWGGETRAFGFALSPRDGAELRRRAALAAQEGRPLRLRARVRSSFSDGAIEAVSACIPGESAEEVLLVAHLCHPAPCANDNASGAAAALEIARGLHAMVEAGRLPRPRRSIRVLWVPEMTGTYLYLAHHEERIARTVAGLNLDMVGADQAQTGSVNVITHTSDALPSFAGDLLEALREQTHGPAHSFHGRSEPPLYRHGSGPFSNGSDHYILGDPSVGIATPLIIEWPDRFYHTTADTIEKVSPATLQRNMRLAAAYVWAVASAGPREAAWLAREQSARFSARLARELQSAVTAALGGAPPQGAPWWERLAFRLDRHGEALASLRRLDPGFDPSPHQRAAEAQVELLWARAADVLEPWRPAERPELSPADAALTPRRRFRGPLSLQPHLARLPAAEREALLEEHRAFRQLSGLSADIALFWADGRRTLGQILDLLELETDGRQPEALAAHFKLLARLGLIDLG